jgi:hypothetical protein
LPVQLSSKQRDGSGHYIAVGGLRSILAPIKGVSTMNTRFKKRNAIHPSVTEAGLEERLVLSSTAVTPAPGPPPVFSRILIGNARPHHTRKHLHAHALKAQTTHPVLDNASTSSQGSGFTTTRLGTIGSVGGVPVMST